LQDYLIIRKIRKDKKITLRQLAEKSGLSLSFLSNLENGRVNVTLSSLRKIAAALEVPVARLIAEDETEGVVIVKKEERMNLVHHRSPKGTVIQQFLTRSPNFDLEIVVIQLPAGTSSESYKSHQGQEFTYVLEGETVLCLNDSTYLLSAGDMAYYDASIPHKWENNSSKQSEILVGATPANF
jgi:transcriptional regulator with XRE-family HTH domain